MDVSLFSAADLIMILLIIMGVYILFKELYIANHHGKLIARVGERRALAICWVIMLVLWVLLGVSDVKN